MKSTRSKIYGLILSSTAIAFASLPGSASAQLVECQQVDGGGNVNAPGGCIGKTLNDQIGTGRGDIVTPGSSIYLINRDPARSIRRGRQLFQRKFSTAEGNGPRVNFTSTGDITQSRALGAGMADSCAACHGRPRGAAGFGGDVNTFPDSRDAPHLFGLGLVEMLADEMTSELRATRSHAIASAQNGTDVVALNANFGSGAQGFVFVDDAFNGTNNPTYTYATIGFFFGSTKLYIELGGLNNNDIIGMSGAWERVVNVPAATTGQLSFQYRLTQAADYESDEFSHALVSVNGGVPQVVAVITGDGTGGSFQSTDLQTASIDLDLVAGNNTIRIGAYNNKKTSINEVTAMVIDDVVVTTSTGPLGPVTRDLVGKGVDFGQITAFPDGSVDLSQAEGVDADLRIKPFFHDGRTISMREFIIGALNDEMGLQAWDPVLCNATDPLSPQSATSPAGFNFDPALDAFSRPQTCTGANDPDGDGVSGEIDPALIDHLEFYLLNYFKPGQYRVSGRAQDGLELMEDIGCTSCHVKDLTINEDRRVADVETNYDPVRGIFNDLFAEAALLTGDPIVDGQTFPILPPAKQQFIVRNIFSDLKRHDLGPKFHERDFDGTRVTEFVTEPLWGVGSTAPYGHDGRSINLDAVIRRHGGDAAAVTNAYVALHEDDQQLILEFLQTLVLFPPDDTASDLNPGVPGSPDPQDPANHGSINLGALFQIPVEGGE